MTVKSRDKIFLESIYAFIETMQAEQQRSPTIREMMEAGFTTSSSVMRFYLDAMEARGMIRRDPGISRGIRIIKRDWWESLEHKEISTVRRPLENIPMETLRKWAEETDLDLRNVAKVQEEISIRDNFNAQVKP
jgi:SOS-response transcriptional repressor LexA